MNLVRDHIAALRGYTPGEQPAESEVIKLNTNENPYPPSPRALAAIHSITSEQLRRYPSPDARVFREAAARVHGVSAENILATNGGDELLALVFRACLGEGDRVAFLEPSYSLYPVLAAMQNAATRVLPYVFQGAAWRVPEEIFKLDARLLVLTNPNAPSGTWIDLATLERIVRHFAGLVLIDEAYVDFADASALPLVQKFPNVILLRSLSKGYSLAGLRFGYGIAQPALLAELSKVRDSYPCDAVAIAAATAAILDQAYARQTWQRVRQGRAWLIAQLRACGFALPDSASNFVLAQAPSAVDAAGLYQQLKARHILVRYFALPRLADKLRITVGTPEQNQKLLQVIQELINAGRGER